MTGFESKRQAAQDKMELADAYASAVAATPNMPTPLERKLAVERIERARNALEAALEQQAEPPPEWPLIKNILAVFGLDAIAFVAKWQAAQQQAEPVQERITRIAWDERGVRTVNGIPDDAPKRQWVGLTDEEITELRLKTFDAVATNYESYRAIEAKLKAKNDH